MRLTALLLVLIVSSSLRAQTQDSLAAPFDMAADTFSDDGLLAPNVTPLHLIARPEVYNGHTVIASGYLHYQFEDSALYLSKEDADYIEAANAVWVTYADSCHVRLIANDEWRPCREGLQEMDGRHVMLRGQFVAGRGGHFGMYYGTLRDVERVSENRRFYDGRENLWEEDENGRLRPRE